MTSRSSSVALALVFALAGCDFDDDVADDAFRSHPSHGHGHGHGHGHHHGHHGHHHHGRADDCQALDISDLLENYDEATNPYSDPALWLSGPDADDDFVLSVNLDTTIVYPDLSTEVIHPEPAQNPELDIFYIHPTVNLSTEAGNDDLSDLTNTKSFVAESAARFSTIGRVISPLYHSATAGCLLVGGEVTDGCFEIAYEDVEHSFEYYLANHWEGQKLVIMGWSQGAVMTRMLMQRFVANHPDLMSRVAVVMPMSGDLKDDSFDEIPACEAEDQTGCYITYHAFLDSTPPQAGTVLGDWSDTAAACTDVVGAAGEAGVFTMSYFSLPTAPGMLPTDALSPIPLAIDTSYMAFPNYYAGDCVQNSSGSYAEVTQLDPGGDQRWTPINYSHPFIVTGPPFGLGLHVFDWSLGMGDLMQLVEAKADELEDDDGFCVNK